MKRCTLLVLILAGLSACGVMDFSKDKDNDNDLLLLMAVYLSNGCNTYQWNLPANFPIPVVPADNCISQAKVELGQRLFYDKRLSGNESMSCASCHFQNLAFADGKDTPTGIPHTGFPSGEKHPRNSQHLTNAGYNSRQTWANSTLTTLELQAAGPLFGESGPSNIVELGLTDDTYLDKLRMDELYPGLFSAAFGISPGEINELKVRQGIGSFVRTMISGNSSYDQHINGTGTVSAAALRGALVFNGEKAECFHCHGGFNFADTVTHTGTVFEELRYHNNGLYSDTDYAAKNANERGLSDVTGKSSDEGRFRAPSLRNIGVTFPYMHDGSIACDAGVASDQNACARNALGKVVDHYMSGGKQNASSQVHPTVDKTLIRPFTLSAQEKSDLIEFLMVLTDTEFLTNPAFSNPAPDDSRFGQ